MRTTKSKAKESGNEENLSSIPPRPAATTMEQRENELISLAYDAAEQRIRDGTASSQEIIHFLKLGSSTDRLQKKLMESDMKLKDAKVQALESAEHLEKIYSNAIEAMKQYSGVSDE